jgi:hypothetical protein
MAIRFFDEWERRNPDGSRTHEMHGWLSFDPPARPRRRARDAAAGAPNEMAAGKPVPGGEPPVYRGSSDPEGDVPSTGGLPAASKRQGTEPESAGEFDQTPAPAARFDQSPEFVDARSLRLVGRDQNGNTKMWGMTRWMPTEQPDGHLEQTGDDAIMALRDLASAAGRNEILGLGQLQKLLDLHYGTRRRR